MSSSVHPADSPPCRAHAAAQRGEQRPPLPRRARDGAHSAHARPRADSGFGGLKQKGSAAGSRQVPGGTRGPPGRHVPAHLCTSIRHTPATTAGNETTRAASTGQCRVSLLRRFAGGSQSRHVTSRLPGQGGGTRKYRGAASHLPPRGEAGHPVRVL